MIVLVVGMHRSGTSLVAGLLHKNGVLMGRQQDFSPPPMRENPKGFFENRRFRAINDRILRHNYYHVKRFGVDVPMMPELPPGSMYEMMHLIKEYNDSHACWGWKDPRTMLTLGCWLKALENTKLFGDVKLVRVSRNPADVARSMIKRGNKEQYKGQFEALAGAYATACDCHRPPTMPHVDIDFDDLLAGPTSELQKITDMTGITFSDISHLDLGVSKHFKAVENG